MCGGQLAVSPENAQENKLIPCTHNPRQILGENHLKNQTKRNKNPPKNQKELEHNAAVSHRADPLLRASTHRKKLFAKQLSSWAEIQRTALKNHPSTTKFPPASLSPKLFDTCIKPKRRREVMRTSDDIQLYPPSLPIAHTTMSPRLRPQQREKFLHVLTVCRFESASNLKACFIHKTGKETSPLSPNS